MKRDLEEIIEREWQRNRWAERAAEAFEDLGLKITPEQSLDYICKREMAYSHGEALELVLPSAWQVKNL